MQRDVQELCALFPVTNPGWQPGRGMSYSPGGAAAESGETHSGEASLAEEMFMASRGYQSLEDA